MSAPHELHDLEQCWDRAGKADPFWAVLSVPDKRGNRWLSDDFFASGVEEMVGVMALVERVGLEGRRRALDFGCGPGRLTQALTKYFDHVDGVDIAPSMVELANSLNQFPDRCSYRQNSAGDLRFFEDASFDFVYSNITLQHVETSVTRNYIREFLRVIRPGGLLVFQLPGRRTGARSTLRRFMPAFAMGLYHRVRYRNHPAAVMNGIPREEVVALVEASGARVLETDTNEAAGAGWESFRYTCRRG